MSYKVHVMKTGNIIIGTAHHVKQMQYLQSSTYTMQKVENQHQGVNIMWPTWTNGIHAPVLEIDINIVTLNFPYKERGIVYIGHREHIALVHL